MTTWILIIFVGIGGMSDREANSLASVPGFANEPECRAAGKEFASHFESGTKAAKFACVKQTSPVKP